METRAPKRSTNEEATFQKLAEDLRQETSPQVIFSCLKALREELDDPHTAGHRTHIFLQAGGLLPLIRHLMGTTSTTSSQAHASPIDPSDLSHEAARTLSWVLGQGETALELRVAKGLLPPLIDALRGAPAMPARTTAAFGLAMLAEAQPGERRAMVEAGVLDLVFALYDDLAEEAWLTNTECQAANLVCELMRDKVVRARELERAIRGAGPVGKFSALVLLQISNGCSRTGTSPSPAWPFSATRERREVRGREGKGEGGRETGKRSCYPTPERGLTLLRGYLVASKRDALLYKATTATH
jgi:hypothetical protein